MGPTSAKDTVGEHTHTKYIYHGPCPHRTYNSIMNYNNKNSNGWTRHYSVDPWCSWQRHSSGEPHGS